MTVQHSLGFHYSFVKSNSFVAMVILIIKGVKVQKLSIYTIMYYLYVLLCIILTRLEGVKTAENLNIEKFFKMLVFV